jgi:hypothetical protein
VSGGGELVERGERQLDLMRQRLLGFVAGEYAIGKVIAVCANRAPLAGVVDQWPDGCTYRDYGNDRRHEDA